jgi:hypothetical protein
MMNLKSILLSTLATLLLASLSMLRAADTPTLARKPNLILILADDLGYETVGANGGTSYRSSFFPQLRGERGRPRDWIYSWYSPRQGADLTVREFAFNQRFKLYRSGDFFDLSKDVPEKQPLKVSSLEGEAAAAAKLLQAALDQFKDARPADLDRPSKKPAQGKAKTRKKQRP